MTETPRKSGGIRSATSESPKTALQAERKRIESGGWSTYPAAGRFAQAR
jgi:hypothetical protein